MDNYYKTMKANKKAFIFLLAFAMIFLFSNVSAATLESYGTKQVNEQFTFTQVCADATYINLSSIDTPSSVVYVNAEMTNIGSGQFSYNYTPTEIGRYDFRGISDGCEKTFATYVEVTYTGTEFTIQQSYIYIIALVILISIGVGLYFLNTKINGEHSRNDKGEITLINYKGFLKPVILVGIWLVGMVSIFIMSNLGFAFLPNSMIGELFFTIYQVMFWGTIIGLPIGVLVLIVKIVKSVKVQDMVDRGMQLKTF